MYMKDIIDLSESDNELDNQSEYELIQLRNLKMPNFMSQENSNNLKMMILFLPK